MVSSGTIHFSTSSFQDLLAKGRGISLKLACIVEIRFDYFKYFQCFNEGEKLISKTNNSYILENVDILQLG